MATVMLKAHFDGEQIRLDEPVELAKNAQLTVIVHDPDAELAAERADWLRAGEEAFSRCYGDDEPEYTIEDCKP